VANVSLAFSWWWTVAFPRLLLNFLLFSALAQLFDEKVADVSLAFEQMMDGVLLFQGFCWPFYYSPRMRRFLKRRWPMWALPLSRWWMECCISKAFIDLFTILRACAGFWREDGKCEPGLWTYDRWSVALPRLLLACLLISAHAQVFDEKVANVSLSFQLMMDGVLLFQGWSMYGVLYFFTTLHACADFWREGGEFEPGL
jgi:hypothetical protein